MEGMSADHISLKILLVRQNSTCAYLSATSQLASRDGLWEGGALTSWCNHPFSLSQTILSYRAGHGQLWHLPQQRLHHLQVSPWSGWRQRRGLGRGDGTGWGGEGWAGWFWVKRQKTDVNCVNQLIGGFRWHLQAELFVWIDTLLSASLLLQQVLHSVAGPGVGGAPWQKRPRQKIGGEGGPYLPQSTTGRRISCTFIHLSCPLTVLTVDTNCCTSASVDILKACTQRWWYFQTRPNINNSDTSWDLRVEAERTDPQNAIVHFSCSIFGSFQLKHKTTETKFWLIRRPKYSPIYPFTKLVRCM